MADNIKNSDVAMLIGTPRLKQRLEEGGNNNLKFEVQNILAKDKEMESQGRRFLTPLLLEGDGVNEAFPAWLGVQGDCIDLSDVDYPHGSFAENVIRLIDVAYDQEHNPGLEIAKRLCALELRNLRLRAGYVTQELAVGNESNEYEAFALALAADVATLVTHRPLCLFYAPEAEALPASSPAARTVEFLRRFLAASGADVKSETEFDVVGGQGVDFFVVVGIHEPTSAFPRASQLTGALGELALSSFNEDKLVPILVRGGFGSAFPAIPGVDFYKSLIHNLRANNGPGEAAEELHKLLQKVHGAGLREEAQARRFACACSVHSEAVKGVGLV